MTPYTTREAIAGELLADAIAHEHARFDEIGRRFDSLERTMPPGNDGDLATLRIALTFWDGWIDARNQGWQQSRSIQPQEWPVLARGVAADLMADRKISDARIRSRFDAATCSPGSERVQSLATRLRNRDPAR
ncbi:MAG TPA: hypothetical protein VLN59_06720 [Burkholderiales bacterium]|nr:hypothetical protein [Burkholderiales bacterium]